MARTWRRYTFTPPGGRVRDQHELVVRDCAPEVAPAAELDGRPIGRAAAAWVLTRWRRSREGAGAALWVTRYGHPRGG